MIPLSTEHRRGQPVATGPGCGSQARLTERLHSIGLPRSHRRGEHLVHQGFDTGAVLLVLEGTLRVSSTTSAGDTVLLAIRGPGDLLGELGALSGSPAGADVVTREKCCVAMVPNTLFRNEVLVDPELMTELVRYVVARLYETEDRRIRWTTQSVVQRVAWELLAICGLIQEAAPGAVRDGSPTLLTQCELAGLCGASRSTVALAVADLRQRGMIDTRKGYVAVLDPEGLGALAVTPPTT